MKKRRSFIYLHMSVRALLTGAVFVAVGAGVLYFLIARGIINPPATVEELHVQAVYVPVSSPELTAAPTYIPSPSPSVDTVGALGTDATSSVALLSPYASLAFGDDNRSVLQLQQRLVELGYLESDAPSTVFNTSVETAVKYFQRACGMDMTGIADASLQKLLFSESAQPYRIRLGDTGDDVAAAQLRLKDLGYYSALTTGYFGPQTEEAVTRFEYRNGLTADGVLDISDWKQLYSNSAGQNAAPSASSSSQDTVSAAAIAYPYSGEGLSRAVSDQMDKPYVWGKEGPEAFDGSGLVRYCLGLCGVNIGKTEPAGYAEITGWQKIEKTQLIKKGDLLFFKNDVGDQITHVGISVGTSYFIHASSSSGKVVLSSLTEEYWARNFVFARRVFHG